MANLVVAELVDLTLRMHNYPALVISRIPQILLLLGVVDGLEGVRALLLLGWFVRIKLILSNYAHAWRPPWLVVHLAIVQDELLLLVGHSLAVASVVLLVEPCSLPLLLMAQGCLV